MGLSDNPNCIKSEFVLEKPNEFLFYCTIKKTVFGRLLSDTTILSFISGRKWLDLLNSKESAAVNSHLPINNT